MTGNHQTAISYTSSALLHLGLIGAVVWSATTIPTRTAVPSSVRTDVADHRPGKSRVGESRFIEVADDESETPIDQTSPPLLPDTGGPGLGDFARRRLRRAQEEAQRQPTDKQLADLESLGRRLEQVASTASVQEMSRAISGWLGTNQRATEPSASGELKAGEFDLATAQISDVRQLEDENGVTYVATLVDARGNTSETVLDAADGPQLFETFELMKRFPLLESVYRGTVMGLLDKLVTSEVEKQGSAAESPSSGAKSADQ